MVQEEELTEEENEENEANIEDYMEINREEDVRICKVHITV
jgi:hypothetical protein